MKTTTNCEYHETLVSTWLDGELDRPGQLECLDHLARCESCRTFYLEARALDGLVATVRTPAGAEAPSPEVWKRIEWMTRSDRKGPRRRLVPMWAMQAAAVLVVAIGLSVTVWNGGLVAPAPAEAEIVLGEGSEMTETRFVELTREVLQADPRYHAAMRQIMEQVERDTAVTGEASLEGMIQRSNEGEIGENAEAGSQVPA